MKDRQRVVLDTNVLISRLLLPDSIPGKAVRLAIDRSQLLLSDAALEELADVLARPKFDRYVTSAQRQEFIRLLGRIAEMIPIIHSIRECRDPRDNKFLELAVNGDANLVVSGDRDLLALHPFRDVAILTPADYLEDYSGSADQQET